MSSIVSGILKSSKQELLAFISSMDHSDLQHLLFCFLKQMGHSFVDKLVDKHWDNDNIKDRECFSKIHTHFDHRNHPIAHIQSNETQCEFITKMPASIAAYILSFNDMKDVLKCSLVCRSFYEYCQIPMATEHLVIDHAFTKALYNNTVNYMKYSHIKSLTVNYVFGDSPIQSNRYVGFEDKYYRIIAKILRKSPELHTIRYHLDYKRFKYNLDERGVRDPSAGKVGHLLTWVNEVLMRLIMGHWFSRDFDFNSRNVFRSVRKLIWTPSQPYFAWGWGWQQEWQDSIGSFRRFFPNLRSLTLPNTKLYKADVWFGTTRTHGDKDLEWHLFGSDCFVDTMEHINVNMVPKYTRNHTRNGTLNH
eukprot:1039032_1